MSIHTSKYIHLIIKTDDYTAALTEVNTLTAGLFGNLAAHLEGEKIANCMPANCTDPISCNGFYYFRVAIDPIYETLWPIQAYASFEILPYDAWVTETIEIKELDYIEQVPTEVPIVLEYIDTGEVEMVKVFDTEEVSGTYDMEVVTYSETDPTADPVITLVPTPWSGTNTLETFTMVPKLRPVMDEVTGEVTYEQIPILEPVMGTTTVDVPTEVYKVVGTEDVTRPNRANFHCGDVAYTDEEGVEQTSVVMLGGWGV